MKQVKNFADVESLLGELGFKPSYEKNIRAALRKSTKAYATDALTSIPVDLAAYDAKWGRGRVTFIPSGFKTKPEFVDWRKLVRSALVRSQINVPKATLSNSWTAIREAVSENQGTGRLLGFNSDLSIAVLAQLASQADRTPSQLDDYWIDETHRDVNANKRDSFRRGIKRFNTLIENKDLLPAISELLPEHCIVLPKGLGAARNPWRRNAKPSLAPLTIQAAPVAGRFPRVGSRRDVLLFMPVPLFKEELGSFSSGQK